MLSVKEAEEQGAIDALFSSYLRAAHGRTVRLGLAAGGSRVRTVGSPIADNIFETAPESGKDKPAP
jgi:hypothetical protein